MERYVMRGIFLYLFFLFFWSAPAGRTSDSAKMDRLLGAVDKPTNWPAPDEQSILRLLLSAPSKSTTAGGWIAVRGNVEENLQDARDQASRAEAACRKASSGSDKEARMAAAEEARYAAQSAREAAERASGQAENTPADVSDLAAKARDAADRAQAAADRAAAIAEGGGW